MFLVILFLTSLQPQSQSITTHLSSFLSVPNNCNGALVTSLLHLSLSPATIVECLYKPYTTPDHEHPYFLKMLSNTSTDHKVNILKYLSFHNLSLTFQASDQTEIEEYQTLSPQSSQVIEIVNDIYGYTEYACLHQHMFVHLSPLPPPTSLHSFCWWQWKYLHHWIECHNWCSIISDSWCVCLMATRRFLEITWKTTTNTSTMVYWTISYVLSFFRFNWTWW